MSILDILKDYTLQIVTIGSAALGILSGVLGSFAVIRKQSLVGDMVSHAALPGIALAFIITGTKNTIGLLTGALISGLIALNLILVITKNSKVKFDTALALILSVFFGGGMVLLTYIQKVPNANQAGLDKFIFGQASTLLKKDVELLAYVGIALIALIIVFWKEFKLVSFDPDFAKTLGFSTKKIDVLLSSMTVVAVIIGLQTVGVILMSSMIIAPGVAARQWSNKLHVVTIISGIFGAISGAIGTVISSGVEKLPTGPVIVVVVTIIVIVSLIFGRRNGVFFKHLKKEDEQCHHNLKFKL